MYKPPVTISYGISEEIKQNAENAFFAKIKTEFNIDKKELMDALKYDRGQYAAGYTDGLQDAVKHGHWIVHHDSDGEYGICSVCDKITDFGSDMFHDWVKAYNYCPRCGAKMDKE